MSFCVLRTGVSSAPAEEAKTKDELNKFVDAQVSEFQELFGAMGKDGGKDTAGTPGPGEGSGAEKADLLDPKNNDLIPRD